MDIRKTLKPFATKVPNNKRKPPTKKIKNAGKVYIDTGTAEIYNDGKGICVNVDIWGYSSSKDRGSAHTPGPTIEVKQNKQMCIDWVNHIPDTASMPVEVVVTGPATPPTPYLHNVVGAQPTDIAAIGDNATGFSVSHFHGGKTSPLYDGWPESMMAPQAAGAKPSAQLCRYDNEQRAGLYWYHDHAMHTTRLNVYSGLAGCWVIRSDLEREIGLWDSDGRGFGRFDELILVLQDRNVSGSYICPDNLFVPTGKLLHRVETGHQNMMPHDPVVRDPDDEDAGSPLEFYGPLTLVNGKLWPSYERLDAGLYRVRILNGSNARVYRLHLLKRELSDDGQTYDLTDCSALVNQIGTDCGLLPEAVMLPNGCLTLASAERADLLIDFSDHPNSEFILINSAESPFSESLTPEDGLSLASTRLLRPDGTPTDPVYTPDTVDDRNPYPEVLMFKVGEVSGKHPNTTTLNSIKAEMKVKAKADFDAHKKRISDAKTGKVRTVLLVEKEMPDGTAMLVHQELVEEKDLPPAIADKALSAQYSFTIDGVKHYVVAERFQDPCSFIVEHGTSEKWRFINISGDTHPMHIHLVQFLAVSRSSITFDPDDRTINTSTAKAIDENEKGFKDTVRVNPSEIVEVEAVFEGHTGRYLYHCHILEHEDHDMMRQFVVTRDDNYGHSDMWPVSVKKS